MAFLKYQFDHILFIWVVPKNNFYQWELLSNLNKIFFNYPILYGLYPGEKYPKLMY